jgi:hypothetical protein
MRHALWRHRQPTRSYILIATKEHSYTVSLVTNSLGLQRTTLLAICPVEKKRLL